MTRITLSRMHMCNYKIFDDKLISFMDHLNIFDGPNGYGKTSIFDAIEFVITGSIRRVVDNSAINGALKYKNNFLANNSQKDVLIKAEFVVSDDEHDPRTIVIAKKIPGINSSASSADRNPKKIADITKTYILPSFDTEELRDDFLVPKDKLLEKQIELFGYTSQNMYTMLYYIQQEGRLDFFENNEKERVRYIDILFHINQEKLKLQAIDQAKKKLNKILQEIDENIHAMSKDMNSQINSYSVNPVEHSRLFSRDIPWDNSEVQFKDEKSLQEAVHKASGVRSFIQNLEWYKKDLLNRKFKQFLALGDEDRLQRLYAVLLYTKIGTERDAYLQRKKTFEFIKKQNEIAGQGEYTRIDYKMLAHILHIQIDQENITDLLNNYQHNQNTLKTTQQALTTVLQIRQQLINKSEELFDKQTSTICLLCGYDWRDVDSLNEQITKTKNNLEHLGNESTQICIKIVGQLRELYSSYYQKPLIRELEVYNSDYLFNEFIRLDSPSLLQVATNTRDLLNKDLSYEFSSNPQENIQTISSIQSSISESITVLPPEYETGKDQFGYDQVNDIYFSSIFEAGKLTLEEVDKKINYLRYSYQRSQQDIFKKIEILKGKRDKIKSEIAPQLEDYLKKWKQSILKYQSQIISKIEIPFYIYSARVLQSYQGGQGILMKQNPSATAGEVDSIRFTPPGQEHDVVYTMSSGQLSGILLSFSLSLHKIFAGDGLAAIFIDDPVQCMDDLNIVSFVELLQSEFSQTQLIISTHEKSFSNYITYKYKKHYMEYQRINLKELNVM